LTDTLAAGCRLPADLIDGLQPIIDFLFFILQFLMVYDQSVHGWSWPTILDGLRPTAWDFQHYCLLPVACFFFIFCLLFSKLNLSL